MCCSHNTGSRPRRVRDLRDVPLGHTLALYTPVYGIKASSGTPLLLAM